MADYIDRTALLKWLCDDDPSHMEDYYYNAIVEFPDTDVVEVVRCKDCTRYMARSGRCWKMCFPMGPDDYCSRAERKVGDE